MTHVNHKKKTLFPGILLEWESLVDSCSAQTTSESMVGLVKYRQK